MKDAIKYKDVWAAKGSNLHTLLTAAKESKKPEEANEFRKKAEQQYKDCEAVFRRLTGS